MLSDQELEDKISKIIEIEVDDIYNNVNLYVDKAVKIAIEKCIKDLKEKNKEYDFNKWEGTNGTDD